MDSLSTENSWKVIRSGQPLSSGSIQVRIVCPARWEAANPDTRGSSFRGFPVAVAGEPILHGIVAGEVDDREGDRPLPRREGGLDFRGDVEGVEPRREELQGRVAAFHDEPDGDLALAPGLARVAARAQDGAEDLRLRRQPGQVDFDGFFPGDRAGKGA